VKRYRDVRYRDMCQWDKDSFKMCAIGIILTPFYLVRYRDVYYRDVGYRELC